jgi:putative transposase
LQRSVSRKYLSNKKGESYCKTKNIIRKQKQLLKLQKRLNDIRSNYIKQVSSDIVKQKPSFICMEDLNVAGMLRNRHLAKAIQQQLLGEFYRMVNYKADWLGIWFVTANRYFPSSKMCCICKRIKSDLKLSDRVYYCICGNVIDRDYQASINLRDYGANELRNMLAG